MTTKNNNRGLDRPRSRLKVAGVAVAKVLVAIIVIWGIAFAITVFDTDGKVPESQADIYDLNFFGPKPNQERFHLALESMGHPEPQVFDLNGNVVHFSVNYHREEPAELLRRYQREFVHQGLNDRSYLSLAEAMEDEGLTTRLTGGLTPVEMGPERIVMAGMLTRNRALNEQGLRGSLMETDDLDLFRGHRWVEIFREPNASQTTVLASWSDENFSYEKMFASRNSDAHRSFDPDVPACPGCTRVNHFADLEDPRGYRSNIFVTSMGSDQMVTFYRQAMRNRDWYEESEFHEAYDNLLHILQIRGEIMERLSFRQGERQLEIFIFPLEGREIAIQTVLWERGE